MGEDRLAKVAKECRPQSVRSRGRPKKKRWKVGLNANPKKKSNGTTSFIWRNRRRPNEKIKKKKNY